MNNVDRTHRCVQCGKVDQPVIAGKGPGWIAIAMWAAVGFVAILSYAFEAAWLSLASAVLLLPTLIYTLWYFFQREKACRHCGSREFGAAE